MINARTGFFSPASKRSFRLLFVAFFPVCVPCVAGVLREIKVREYLSGGHEREALIAFSHASIPPSNSLQTCATQAMFCVEKNREMPLIVCLFRVNCHFASPILSVIFPSHIHIISSSNLCPREIWVQELSVPC